jgi:hypothetical protein
MYMYTQDVCSRSLICGICRHESAGENAAGITLYVKMNSFRDETLEKMGKSRKTDILDFEDHVYAVNALSEVFVGRNVDVELPIGSRLTSTPDQNPLHAPHLRSLH